jgi:hypothetical protein
MASALARVVVYNNKQLSSFHLVANGNAYFAN